MSKIATYVFCGKVVLGAVGAFYAKQLYDAEQRGAAQERAKVVARANREIATRRVRDAQFDKMDARQHCLDAGLQWVFGDDGKSFAVDGAGFSFVPFKRESQAYLINIDLEAWKKARGNNEACMRMAGCLK